MNFAAFFLVEKQSFGLAKAESDWYLEVFKKQQSLEHFNHIIYLIASNSILKQLI